MVFDRPWQARNFVAHGHKCTDFVFVVVDCEGIKANQRMDPYLLFWQLNLLPGSTIANVSRNGIEGDNYREHRA